MKQITVRFCCISSVLARSKARVCGQALAGIAGSNPVGSNGCLSPVCVLCWVETSARAEPSSSLVVQCVCVCVCVCVFVCVCVYV